MSNRDMNSKGYILLYCAYRENYLLSIHSHQKAGQNRTAPTSPMANKLQYINNKTTITGPQFKSETKRIVKSEYSLD